VIELEVWLYGPLSRFCRQSHADSHARLTVQLAEGSRIKDLLAALELPTAERGITFINGTLSALPQLQPDLDQVLSDGDRVAFFHTKSMWPFQYRHGVETTQKLAEAVSRNPFHHDPGSTP
jgi:sulfur carrier protein ThiS